MMRLLEKEDIAPVCPHCAEQVDELWFRELKSDWGRRYVYFCPKCRKIVGVSHRKGFWMG
jgi:hypothetical protein